MVSSIGPVNSEYANGPGDWVSILSSSHTKHHQKMVLDAALINIKHYKVQIKSKVEQSMKRSCALSYISM